MKHALTRILPILIAATSLSACSTKGSIDISSSKSSVVNYPKVKQLTNADGVKRRSYLYGDDEYTAFKGKMKDFAYQMSEYFINSEYKNNANFAFSPYSIELCLGLAIKCTNNQTRKEILDAMGVDYETFNKYYPYFYSESSFTYTNEFDGKVTALSSPTNSIWLDNDLKTKSDCLNELQDDYYCDVFQVDFNKNNKAANEAIGKFASDKTNGLVNPSFNLDTQTLFVLMNTIYLRGIWNKEGNDLIDASETYKFKNSSGLISNKRLMAGYYHNGRALNQEDYSAFYTTTSSSFNITFIKPNEGKSIKDVFTKENIDYVTGNHYVIKDEEKLERYYTNCVFPSFEAEAKELDLKKPFAEQYNVKSLFNPLTCDFSNLTSDDAYVDTFKQDAKLKVDKTGIEGAAVTYMVAPGATAPIPDPYTDVYETFVVDKEFGFIVRSNNNILFSGAVTNID